jgi:hypothetical protein
MNLLYRLAEWHALAKLRMHTESTLTLMDTVTTQVAHATRKFRDDTASAFTTVELPKEAAARQRSKKKGQAKTGSAHQGPSTLVPVQPSTLYTAPAPMPGPSQLHSETGAPQTPTPPAPPNDTLPAKETKRKMLNLNTYKFHALADYVQTIRMFGTTDSYSTQSVSVRFLSLEVQPQHHIGRTRAPSCETAVWTNEQESGHQTDDPT